MVRRRDLPRGMYLRRDTYYGSFVEGGKRVPGALGRDRDRAVTLLHQYRGAEAAPTPSVIRSPRVTLGEVLDAYAS